MFAWSKRQEDPMHGELGPVFARSVTSHRIFQVEHQAMSCNKNFAVGKYEGRMKMI